MTENITYAGGNNKKWTKCVVESLLVSKQIINIEYLPMYFQAKYVTAKVAIIQ